MFLVNYKQMRKSAYLTVWLAQLKIIILTVNIFFAQHIKAKLNKSILRLYTFIFMLVFVVDVLKITNV